MTVPGNLIGHRFVQRPRVRTVRTETAAGACRTVRISRSEAWNSHSRIKEPVSPIP